MDHPQSARDVHAGIKTGHLDRTMALIVIQRQDNA
jgi:hypothetical protein